LVSEIPSLFWSITFITKYSNYLRTNFGSQIKVRKFGYFFRLQKNDKCSKSIALLISCIDTSIDNNILNIFKSLSIFK